MVSMLTLVRLKVLQVDKAMAVHHCECSSSEVHRDLERWLRG